MEGDDGADERGEVDDEHLVVRLHVHRLDERDEVDVGKEVEHVLEEVHDLMVDGKFCCKRKSNIHIVLTLLNEIMIIVVFTCCYLF